MMQPEEVHGRTEKDSRKATARRYVGVQNHRSRATPGLANWPGGGKLQTLGPLSPVLERTVLPSSSELSPGACAPAAAAPGR